MRWRWIAGIVCALYLSVGSIFSAIHDHSGDLTSGDQCAACAWHYDGLTDVPVATPRLVVPAAILVRHDPAPLFFLEIAAGIHGSRGPPSLLL